MNQDNTPKTLDIFNVVNDRLYDPEHVNLELLEALNQELPEIVRKKSGQIIQTPRAGDAITILKSELIEASKTVIKRTFSSEKLSDEFNMQDDLIIQKIFGQYISNPGGSGANTTSSKEKSKYRGEPLYNTTALCVSGEGPDGDSFRAGFSNHVEQLDLRYGEALTCYVIPHSGDRTMYTVINDINPTDDYNISPHIASALVGADFDEVQIEGFAFSQQHGAEMAQTLLDFIEIANTKRAEAGKAPIRLIIGASAQFVCEHNQVFKDFVKQAIRTTDISIHANTGEFRRLFDQDKDWREVWHQAFAGLSGKEEQDAKDANPAYRAAKTKANENTIMHVIREYGHNTSHDLELVITDGGHTGYVINNSDFYEFTPPKLSKSDIKNKVGAGDAFMAGYRVARRMGASQIDAMYGGAAFAKATMAQDSARPIIDDPHATKRGLEGPAQLFLHAPFFRAFEENANMNNQSIDYDHSTPGVA